MGLLDGIADKLFASVTGKTDDKPIQNVFDQTKEEIELASFVKNKVETVRGQANRVASEGVWMTNIAYLLGYNNVFYDPSLKQFRPNDTPRRFIARNRIHSNLILPATQNRLARLLKSPPKYEVKPNSTSNEDKDGARLGEEIIDSIWDEQKINEKRIHLGMWVQECGHAYIKISHDDQLGDELTSPESGDFVGYAGATRADVCSAFEIFPDPLAKTFDDLGFLIQAKVRPLEYFRMHYPGKGEAVKEEGAWLLSAQYEMRINTLSTVGPASSGTAEQMKNCAIELSYYEKRSKKYPKGRHIVSANGVLLTDPNKALPYGEIPFAKFDDVVIGGKYYPECIITHVRPLQDQYDRVLNKRADWTNKLLAGKYRAARPHGVQQESINDQSGEVIEYDPMPGVEPPEAIQVPQMPQYAYNETDYIKKDIYEIYGSSDISRGQLPSAGIPAIGMQILIEQDETRLGIETEQHEHAWARVGKLILKNVSQSYIEKRKLKTRQKSGDFAIREYSGEDLRNNLDVSVIRGSLVPNNKALKRQEVINAWQQGLLGNPQDPTVRELVLSRIEFGDTKDIYRDEALDKAQIQKTIDLIQDEIKPEVNKLDNHALHILEKNRFRKSDKFEEMSALSKDLLEQDIDAHATAAVALTNPQLANPPDNGPPPDQMIAQLNQQAQGLGLPSLDQNMDQGQNNNIAMG